jgi:PAS domain S-box-containing protein
MSTKRSRTLSSSLPASVVEAEAVLTMLTGVLHQNSLQVQPEVPQVHTNFLLAGNSAALPNLEAKYRTLVEQIPAVVFMIYLDRGISEAYVSPQIEALLGFSQQEWLEDPVRWYERIHPGDRARWNVEAADLFLAGNPLRSVYRVIARDGRVVWFHCEANMVRRESGQPWFIHGVGFEITELKQTEQALKEERNFASAILDTVAALIVVLDQEGHIVRFNRACQQTTGWSLEEVKGRYVWELFTVPEELERFKATFEQLSRGKPAAQYQGSWVAKDGARRLIAWSNTTLLDVEGNVGHIIATGIDITESKRLEKALLEISTREQRRIGEDLHDGLGQHLTGIAFMGKALEQKLTEKQLPEAADAAKIVNLVNDAIDKTRKLARGLLPVSSEAQGLMTALERSASEVKDFFNVECHFECEQTVLIPDGSTATHLYHIAQEAVNNAIKHGRPSHIIVNLSRVKDKLALTVTDDGVGLPAKPGTNVGMGLHIMNHRARMIGGSLEVRRCHQNGTIVTCLFPAKPRE